MADPANVTEILLRIQADLDGVSKMTAGFSSFQQKAKDAGAAVEDAGKKVDQMTRSLGGLVQLGAAFGLGAIGVTSMVEAIRSAIGGTTELAAQIKQVTLSTGLAGESAQVFARASLMGMDELTTKLQRYRSILGEALIDPNGPAAKLFRGELGLDVNKLDAAPMEKQLEMIAQSFGRLKSQNEQARVAMELFGRNSGQMLPMLEKLRGPEGFAGLRTEVEGLTGILSNDASKAIHDFELRTSDANSRLSKALLSTNLRLLEMKARVAEFMSEHSSMLTGIGESMAAVGAALAAATSLSMLKIGWAKIGTNAGATMGIALGVALAGAIVLAVADAMDRAIDENDKKLEAAYNNAGIKKKMNPTSEKDAQATLDTIPKEIELLKQKRDALIALRDLDQANRHGNTHDIQMAKDRTGLTQDQLLQSHYDPKTSDDEIQGYDSQIGRLQALQKNPAALLKKGAASGQASQTADDQTAQLTADKEITEELDKQLAALQKQAGTREYAAASDGRKRDILQQESVEAQKQYILESQAADRVGDSTAQTAARMKFQETEFSIKEKGDALDKEIAARKKSNDEADKAALAAKYEAQKVLLEAEQESIQAQLDAVKADRSLSEDERWVKVNALLIKADENAKAYLDTVTKIRNAAPAGSEARLLGDAAVHGAQKDSDKTGSTKAQEGPAPNDIMANFKDKVAEMRRSIADLASQGIGNLMTTAFNGVSNAIDGLISKTMTWRQAFTSVMGAMLKSAISTGSQMVTQWLFNELTKTTATAAGTAARTGMNATEHVASVAGSLIAGAAHIGMEIAKTAASIAGLAMRLPLLITEAMGSILVAAAGAMSAMASIPYVGPILAIIAMAAMIAAGIGLVSKIGKGFYDGGYTGDGRSGEVAGDVHRKEIVWTERDVNRAGGVDAVERLRIGGGSVRGAAGISSSAGVGGKPAVQSASQGVNIAFHNTQQDAEQWLRTTRGKKTMIDFMRQSQTQLA